MVTIIGATFAYFSAQAQTGVGDIQGQTLGGEEAVLGLEVTRVFTATTLANSLDLVSAENIDNASSIATAINAKCEASPGDADTTVYTGCHLYKINVTTGNSPVNGAVLTLDSLSTSNTDNPTDWKFAIFTASVTGNTYSSIGTVNSNNLINNFNAPTGNNALKLINGNLAANTNDNYYLLVYVDNKDTDQSSGTTANVTGTYTGAMTLKTASGNTVRACFGTSGECEISSSFTGTIYRFSTEPLNIGAYISPVLAWCANSTEFGNSCNFGISWSTRSECESYVTNNSMENTICVQGTTTGITEYGRDTSNISSNFYLKHDVVNDIVTASYVEFIVTPEMAAANEGMTAGTYTLTGAGATYNSVNNQYNNDSIYFSTNSSTLLTTFGENSDYCGVYSSNVYCSVDGLSAYAYAYGSVNAHDGSWDCRVDDIGTSRCVR